MAVKQVLIVAQVIPQWYVDLLSEALGADCHIDIITGSAVEGHIIPSPTYAADSLRSRLVSWYRHWRFMSRWMRRNRRRQYDLIFAISNPPINSYIGLKLKNGFMHRLCM